MALEVGNSLSNTGLAGAIHTEMRAIFGTPLNKAAEANAAKFNDALARAIIEYFVANTEVNTAVSTVVETDVETVVTTTVVLGTGTGTGTGTGEGSGTGSGIGTIS